MQTWLAASALVCSTGCVEDVLLARECPGPSCGTLDASRMDAGCASSRDASSCVCEDAGGPRVLAYWPLDEREGRSALDRVGNRGAPLTQSAAQAPWVEGEAGGALAFDGIDDAVEVGALSGALRALSFWIAPSGFEVLTERTPLQLPTAHGPLDQWTDPERAYSDDSKLATVASLIGTKSEHWGGFHLAQWLPSGVLLRGITVTVDTGNIGLLGALSVELSWDGGRTHTGSRYGWGQLIVGSNLRQAGGSEKLWGREWNPAELADATFRVRGSFGGIANAMGIDFVGVQVEYAPQTLARTLFNLRQGTYLAYSGNTIASVGWDASVYVNGALNGALRPGWNHVVVVGFESVNPDDVRLGAARLDTLSFPFEGLMDEVQFFRDALTESEIEGVARAPTCVR